MSSSKKQSHFVAIPKNDGGSLVHRKKNLGFIAIPKCASTSITGYLWQLQGWKSFFYTKHQTRRMPATAAEPFEYESPDLELFTVVRHPLSWIQSGYLMMKQKFHCDIPFDLHVEHLLAGTNPIENIHLQDTWRWHCSLLPDAHIGSFKPRIFRVEQLDDLHAWITAKFPKAAAMPVPVRNISKTEPIEISPSTRQRIAQFAGAYAHRFGYEL